MKDDRTPANECQAGCTDLLSSTKWPSWYRLYDANAPRDCLPSTGQSDFVKFVRYYCFWYRIRQEDGKVHAREQYACPIVHCLHLLHVHILEFVRTSQLSGSVVINAPAGRAVSTLHSQHMHVQAPRPLRLPHMQPCFCSLSLCLYEERGTATPRLEGVSI